MHLQPEQFRHFCVCLHSQLWVNSDREEFAPLGSNFFHSRLHFEMTFLSRKAKRKKIRKLLPFVKMVETHGGQVYPYIFMFLIILSYICQSGPRLFKASLA